MALITVRELDENNDPIQGNGQSCYISDLQAMVQIIRTRLLMFKGEWFLDLLDGLPMFSGGMLGTPSNARNIQIITNLIVARLKTTTFVIDVDNVTSAYQARNFYFAARVQTQFGSVYISNVKPPSTI